MSFNFKINYKAQKISELNALIPLGSLAPLNEPSEEGYNILVGNLSGLVDSETLEAKVCVPSAPGVFMMVG
jgi:hypothetical protein